MRTVFKPLLPAISWAWREWLDLLFPIACLGCGVPGTLVCARCEAGFQQAPAAAKQAYARLPLDSVTAACAMTGLASRVVHSLKYRGVHTLSPYMGARMAQAFAATRYEVDLVVPVPLHPARRRWRGYNQAERLAQVVAAAFRLELNTSLLERRVKTPPLAFSAGIEERRRSVAGAFACTARADGARVLLVDDVITTGSTTEAAAVALREAGAEFVHTLTFAMRARS